MKSEWILFICISRLFVEEGKIWYMEFPDQVSLQAAITSSVKNSSVKSDEIFPKWRKFSPTKIKTDEFLTDKIYEELRLINPKVARLKKIYTLSVKNSSVKSEEIFPKWRQFWPTKILTDEN